MRARKFQAVEIELDAKSVIHLLLNNGVSFADCAPIIDNCRNLLNRLHLWKIQHYYREMNAYVDKLYPFNKFFVWKTLSGTKKTTTRPCGKLWLVKGWPTDTPTPTTTRHVGELWLFLCHFM